MNIRRSAHALIARARGAADARLTSIAEAFEPDLDAWEALAFADATLTRVDLTAC
jgi:hypothetical protein